MSNEKATKRINVTVSLEVDAILERWCKMTGASKSRVVALFMEQSMPRLEAFMDAVERGEDVESFTEAEVERSVAEIRANK